MIIMDDDDVKKVMDLFHSGIGKEIFEKIDDGQIGTTDVMVSDFMATCMSNQHSAKFIGWLIADEFDLDRDEVADFLVNIYVEGEKSLKSFKGGLCE